MPRRLKEFGRSSQDIRPAKSSAPVNKGEQYEVTITGISRQGQGMTKVRGFLVFVPNSRVGQRVTVRISNVGPRHAVGEIIQY